MNSRQAYGNTSDDAVSVARAVVEAINGLRTVLGEVAARTAPGSYSGVDASNTGAASITVPVSLSTELIEIDLATSPNTGGSDLWARFTQGGVPLSGATDYSWSNLRGATFTNNAAAPQFQIATGLQGATGSLRFRSFKLNSSNFRKTFAWDGFIMDNATGLPITISGGGRFNLNTTIPVDGIQFLLSAGVFSGLAFGAKYTAFST